MTVPAITRRPGDIPWFLGSPDFTFLGLARLMVTFANNIQSVSAGWLMYELTRDPLYLGLIGLAEAIPAISLALLAGWLVDRGKPKNIYRLALSCAALASAIMWLASSHLLDSMADARVPALFGASLLTGMARSFLMPSQFSLLPLTVPRPLISRATAWNTSMFQVASMSGPPIGGFLYALGGGGLSFPVSLAMIACAIAMSSLISVGTEKREKGKHGETPLQNVMKGIHFVWTRQVLVAAMALDMFAVLFGGAVALFPIFCRDIFLVGPFWLGIMRCAMPVGAFLMGWRLTRVPITGYSAKVLLYAVAGFGLAMIGFGVSGSYWVACAFLVLAGMCDSVSMVMRHTILQLTTPHALRGRVSSVNSIFIGSSNEIGAFESGVAAKLLGTQASVVFGGIMTLIVVAVAWIKAPKLRKLHLSSL
jgi:MFS family permease